MRESRIVVLGFLAAIMVVVIAAVLVFSWNVGHTYSSKCPSVKEFKTQFFKFQPKFRNLVKVDKVSPAPIPGLCEVLLELKRTGQRAIVYTDSSGRFIITGNIIDMKRRVNLTREHLLKLNEKKLSKKELNHLKKLVNMVYGKKGATIYFITDPECPFCRKAEQIVYDLAKEGKLRAKVILFPLEAIHPGSTKMSVSLICDKKGYKALLKGYSSSNQCKEGKEKVNANVDFIMKKLHITAVPVFITPDGRVRVGIMSKEELLDFARGK